jgi:hypothetical protein
MSPVRTSPAVGEVKNEAITSERCSGAPVRSGGETNHRIEPMAQILPIRRYKAFDPDATWAMGAAYDKAIATVHPDDESQLVIRELIAKRIIQMAQKGVDDRDELCTSVAQKSILFGVFGWRANHNRIGAKRTEALLAVKPEAFLPKKMRHQRDIHRTVTAITAITILTRAKPSITRLE